MHFNNQKWVGFVKDFNEEFKDFEIRFIYPKGLNKYYYYPEIEDVCNIDAKDINKIFSTPSLNAGTSRIQ